MEITVMEDHMATLLQIKSSARSCGNANQLAEKFVSD